MRKRTVKILKGIAIAVVVIGVVYALAIAVSSAKLRRAYANLEKAGRPMNTGNVIPSAVSDAENSALLYESAILLLKAQPASREAGQPAGQENLLNHLGTLSGTFLKESLDADKRAELKQLMEQDVIHRALSIIEQGAQRRSCRFDHDYTAGFNMLLPHLSKLHRSTPEECPPARPEIAWRSNRYAATKP